MTAEEPEPQRHTGYLIRRAQQVHVAAWARLVSTETSSVQYAIIATLDRLGPRSQRQLCDEIDLDRSTIADLVTRMERRGLVRRDRDPADARRKTVTLTPLGHREHERLRPLADEVEHALTDRLTTADRDVLRRTLRLLLESAPDDSPAG
ncbi:MAG: MarR family transcriptional regulator [Microbacterium sp.]